MRHQCVASLFHRSEYAFFGLSGDHQCYAVEGGRLEKSFKSRANQVHDNPNGVQRFANEDHGKTNGLHGFAIRYQRSFSGPDGLANGVQRLANGVQSFVSAFLSGDRSNQCTSWMFICGFGNLAGMAWNSIFTGLNANCRAIIFICIADILICKTKTHRRMALLQ